MFTTISQHHYQPSASISPCISFRLQIQTNSSLPFWGSETQTQTEYHLIDILLSPGLKICSGVLQSIAGFSPSSLSIGPASVFRQLFRYGLHLLIALSLRHWLAKASAVQTKNSNLLFHVVRSHFLLGIRIFLETDQAQSVAFISAGWFNDLDPLLCHYAQWWGSTRNTCWTIIIVSSSVPLGRTFYSLCHDRGQTFFGSVLFVQCAFLVAPCEGGVCYPKASTGTGVLMQCLRPSLTLTDKQSIGVLRMAGLKSSRCTVWRGVG